jgi:hypothetical protein
MIKLVGEGFESLGIRSDLITYCNAETGIEQMWLLTQIY